MKKLILTVAILASGVSTFAMSNNILPIEGINIVMNNEFKEITLDKLPAAVTNAVEKDYASATISKAYVNSKEQYKLDLTIDGNSSTVYADKDGNWIEESATTEKKQGAE
ncbi:hypothetical protein QLS71_011980 [Mariniflexile litorale]|uniref:Beta-lactamase-inhibitor-like PepSY-like domain-containing protein n=1 Tax=Mariniflexile litorale TaxID=3045158 RepID=A0AAU7ECR9_9FLAO|nr:hypothetical protein [Mariniflexile sp. KMM 9835]MDQ8213068.1 hypothetical protein [Mariniflexile sp. KMM 9835]